MVLPQISKRAEDRVSDAVVDNAKFYDKDLCPDGSISLATAENSLMSKELIEVKLFLHDVSTHILKPQQYMHSHFELTPDHLKYRASMDESMLCHVPYSRYCTQDLLCSEGSLQVSST